VRNEIARLQRLLRHLEQEAEDLDRVIRAELERELRWRLTLAAQARADAWRWN
jgi:hypothetical protein